MRGIRFTNLLALPFILGALYVLFNIFFLEKDSWFFYLIPFIVLLLALYFASNDINYWFYKKYPPKLDPPIIAWLNKFFPFYLSLNDDEKQKFEIRLALYLEGRAFKLILKEQKDIPEDFKGIIAAHCIEMTMGLENYLLEPYERIFCYNHPFPTPNHQFLHTVEVEKEDFVILISLEQLMMGVGRPKTFYNIGYHAYAEVLCSLNPDLANISEEGAWETVEEISGLKRDAILKFTGYTILDINIVALAIFFMHTSVFKEKWIVQALHYQKCLNYAY